jgi:hypothetical protein
MHGLRVCGLVSMHMRILSSALLTALIEQIHELFVKEKKSGAAAQVSAKIRGEIEERFSKSKLGRVPSGQKEAMNAVISVLDQFA